MFLHYIHSSNGTDSRKGGAMTPELRAALAR
jgi:hypothetical protein